MMTPRHRREIFALGVVLAGLVAARPARPVDTARDGAGPFIFAYFNTGAGEADGLQFAYSRDGLAWTKIEPPGNSFLSPAVGGGLLRDPSIVQGPDGTFHMVWTTGWFGHGIGLAHSRDLIRWSDQHYLDVMKDHPGYVNAWAPEITFDDKSGDYLIYWASTVPGRFPESEGRGETFKREPAVGVRAAHRMYLTTTKDFQNFTPTALFYDDGYNCIDAFIVRDRPRNRWVMAIKDEERFPEIKKDIRIALAPAARGPWGPSSPPVTPSWSEGAALLQVGEAWLLYFDLYTLGRYGALKTVDFETWTCVTDRLRAPEGMRHGTAFPVREAILQGLLSHHSPPGAPGAEAHAPRCGTGSE